MSCDFDLKTQDMEIVQSRDNPLIKRIRGIVSEVRAYKSSNELWLEGEHLCTAAFDKGLNVEHLVCSQSHL